MVITMKINGHEMNYKEFAQWLKDEYPDFWEQVIAEYKQFDKDNS